MLIISLIVIQILVFLGLIWMFRRILSQNVTSATKHLEELSQEYTRKDKELNQQLQSEKQKSQELLEKSRQEAEKIKTQMIQEAERERDRILKQAHTQNDEIIQQAEKTRHVLLSEINESIAKEAINKACELIQLTLPESFKQEVHTQWIEELIQNGFSQGERLSVPRDLQEVRVISAFSLRDSQRKGLLSKLKEALGREVMLKEEVDTKVIAGLVIMMGSLVLDGSLKHKIKEQAKSVQYTVSE